MHQATNKVNIPQKSSLNRLNGCQNYELLLRAASQAFETWT